MSVPNCKECCNRFVRNTSKVSHSQQESKMTVKEYFKLFEMFAIITGIPINSKPAKEIFILDLSDENKEEISHLSISFLLQPIDENYIRDLVCYLLSVEIFKHDIIRIDV